MSDSPSGISTQAAPSREAPATCDLCDLRLTGRTFTANVDGTDRYFCCAGCRQVFLILHDSGLLQGDYKNSELYQTSLRLGLIGQPQEEDAPSAEPSPEELKNYQELSVHVDGMWCSACSWLIEKVVSSQPGVAHTRVIYASDTAKIYYQPEQISAHQITDTIHRLGYKTSSRESASSAQAEERTSLLLRMGVALFLMMNVMSFSYVLYVGYFQKLAADMQQLIPPLLLILTLPAVFWCGAPIHQKAFRSVQVRAPTMEVLFSISIFAAFFFSVYALIRGYDHFYFDTAVSLVALLLLGKYIEVSAKHKATRGIFRLYRMLPRKVRIKTASGTRLVSVQQLQVGDRFVVQEGEKIATDGRVVAGRATVDESLLTGESRPVEKKPGDPVTGSTINLQGSLEVEALRVGDDTVFAHIIRLVEGALSQKSPLERLVDRIARVFIPFVLLLATVVVGIMLANSSGLEAALLRGITILVIACPCALGLATPLAIAAGVGFAAKQGILVREGEAFQLARKVTTVVFDKTGTLTEGKFTLQQIYFPDYPPEEVLSLVASVEQYSNHPLAGAVVRASQQKDIPLYEAAEVKTVQGRGVAGKIRHPHFSSGEREVIIGNQAFVEEHGFEITASQQVLAAEEEAQGRTVVYFGVQGIPTAGHLSFGDSLKAGVRETVADLHRAGIPVRLLSGDSPQTTAVIAELAGIPHYAAGVLPQDKITVIRRLQQDGAVVAMVGDGVNDAPALAQADIGMAMGSGTEIALASSAVTLLRDDPRLVPKVIDISRRTINVIGQNLVWAFLYNSVGLVLATMGLLNPLFAAVAMLASSLSVVGNSMRLQEERGQARKRLLEILVPWWEPA